MKNYNTIFTQLYTNIERRMMQTKINFINSIKICKEK